MVALTAVDIGDRLKEHKVDPDAHGFASRFLDKTTGGEVTGSLTVHGTVTADGLVLPSTSTRFSREVVITSPTAAVTYVGES
ncbi:hypothetical protein ACF1AO_29890 [Streptomyces longwoodensis]|uniref:hypothetical protein n=1 Tax=Streptomyces longwoodensis TaxID=68231 RepID=UPI0036FCCCBE